MFATIEAPRLTRVSGETVPPPPVVKPQPVAASDHLLEHRHFSNTLLASRPARPRSAGGLGGSVLAHVVILGLLVLVTRPGAAPPKTATADTTLVYLPRVRALETARLESALPRAGTSGNGGRMLVLADPPPKGFQTVIPPSAVPTGLPPVNLNERPLDPKNYTGLGVEGGVSFGVVGGTGAVDFAALDGVDGVVYDGETTEDLRFRKAQVISQPGVRYPPALRMAGVEGRVVLRFVVDTLGAVEPGSIRAVESSHEAFEASAREMILGSRFQPARLGEFAVRQLTIQKINFVMSR